MESPASLAWRQLVHQKRRLLVAILGVAFAVLLILMQHGFRDALFAGTVLLHERLRGEIVLVDRQAESITSLRPFTARRLHQARGVTGVEGASPLHVDWTPVGWRNEQTGGTRSIYVVGFDLLNPAVDLPGLDASLAALKRPDSVVFDALSREEFGPVAERFRAAGPHFATVNRRRVEVVGLFDLGTSFAVDGTVATSEANFLRLFPDRPPGLLNLVVVRVRYGEEVAAVRHRIDGALPDDVLVLTRAEFMAREQDYWDGSTPIGFVFAFGSAVGLLVGAVIVYQVLFADVQQHLPEYATLKAMGFTHAYLSLVVMAQSVILAALGFVPGTLAALGLYGVTHDATHLPMRLGPGVAAAVFALTVGMCAVAGLATLQRLRAADPADIF